MNKVILGLILAVCVLGMALVMLNERLGRKPDAIPAPQQTLTENRQEYRPPAVEEARQQTPVSVPVGEVPPVETAQQPEPARIPVQAAENARGLEEMEAREALEAPRVAETAPPVATPPTPAQANMEQDSRKPAPAPQKPVSAGTNVQAKPEPRQDKPSGKTITRFVVFSRDKGATVRIGGNGQLAYKSMVLDNPDRMVIDLDGQWQFPANPGIPKNELVSNVRVGKLGDKTRIVIDLKAKPRIARVLPGKGGDSLDVRVDK